MKNVVIEITNKCNLNCKHCGSTKNNDELSVEAIKTLLSDLNEVKHISITGGEPTLHKDIVEIVKLCSAKCNTSIITNATCSEKLLREIIDAGIDLISFSVDGLPKTHDEIRNKKVSINMFRLINVAKWYVEISAVTTVTKQNINELREIRSWLFENGFDRWQLQLGIPYGNMTKENMIEPKQIIDIIKVAHETQSLIVDLADCVGYYSKLEHEVRTKNNCAWSGCQAGKSVLGILANGDVVGCTSIRDKNFIEGNIYNESIKDIWQNKFNALRNLCQADLSGKCKNCKYTMCLGGCHSMKIALNNSLYSENNYCMYNLARTEG
jgi:radical SAM protein with 4Fe4S-binding SPASM domain